MRLSIIIPVYNSFDVFKRCFNSIISQAFPKEIVVIDNSQKAEAEVFLKNYPDVVFIKNSENRGAAFARNQGIRAAKGDFIMFLDSDAYLDESFWPNLEDTLKSLPQEVGAISPKIIKSGSGRIFSCGLKISSIYRVFDVGKNMPSKNFNRSFTVDGPNSCCAIYKREVLEEIKEEDYFDNDFFFLFEDADLALWLKKKGYKCIFVPKLMCHHYGGSSGIPGDYRRFLCFRNRWFMILKNNKDKHLFLFLLRSFIYDLIRTIHFAFTNRYFIKAVRQIKLYKKKTIRNN